MRLVIFGSRDITHLPVLERCMETSGIDTRIITEIVSGGARGVDRLAIQYAEIIEKPCRVFYADWTTYGKSAGCIRNVDMAKYADYGLALWDGKSRGTKHMLDLMEGRCSLFIISNGMISHDVL